MSRKVQPWVGRRSHGLVPTAVIRIEVQRSGEHHGGVARRWWLSDGWLEVEVAGCILGDVVAEQDTAVAGDVAEGAAGAVTTRALLEEEGDARAHGGGDRRGVS